MRVDTSEKVTSVYRLYEECVSQNSCLQEHCVELDTLKTIKLQLDAIQEFAKFSLVIYSLEKEQL